MNQIPLSHLLSVMVRIAALPLLLALAPIAMMMAQAPPTRAEIRALRTELRANEYRIDSLEVRLAYLKRDSAIIHHAALDSLPALLQANRFRYHTELAAVTATRVSSQAIYGGILAGAVALNAATGWVSDPGGYEKRWDQWTVFHVTAGAALESAGESMRVPVGWRLASLCGAVAAWESVKGHPDWRDAAAGCSGALLSAGFRALVR